MATLIDRLHQKEEEVKGIISEYEREKRMIPEYAEVFEEYREHPLVWRVMNDKTTFEQDIEENIVNRYKSFFRKYVFDRYDRDYFRTLSLYKPIYGWRLNPFKENYYNITNIMGLGLLSYLQIKEKNGIINSFLEDARYLDSIAEKVKSVS